MNITTSSKLCSELWRRSVLCSLAVIAVAAVATVRSGYLPADTNGNADQIIEMACWRISLLLAFQSAPLVWAHFIYKGYKHKRISVPLYQAMSLLRMPIAAWAAGCLVTAVTLWPALSA